MALLSKGEKRLLMFKEESRSEHSNYPNFTLKLVHIKWEFLLCCAGQLLLLCSLSPQYHSPKSYLQHFQ